MSRVCCPNLVAAWRRNAVVWLAATAVTLFSATALQAQGEDEKPPTSLPRETILRPGDELRQPLGTDKSRDEVVHAMEELMVQQELKGQVLDELKRSHFDGTPGSAIRIRAVDMSLSRDQAIALALVTRAVEDHKFQVWRVLIGQRSKLAETERKRDARSKDVEDLADQVARGQDENGAALTPAQIADHHALLYVTILHRNDLEERCRRLAADCDFYKREIANLNAIDERIDAMSKLTAVHVERQIDALQSEQEALITGDVKASQEDLRKMIAFVRASRPLDSQLPTTAENAVEIRGVSIESAIAELRRELPPEAQKLIDDEIRKAQTRVKQPQAAENQTP